MEGGSSYPSEWRGCPGAIHLTGACGGVVSAVATAGIENFVEQERQKKGGEVNRAWNVAIFFFCDSHSDPATPSFGLFKVLTPNSPILTNWAIFSPNTAHVSSILALL